MKKLLGIIAIAVVASWNSSQSQNEVEMSDLALANVEALANPEGSENQIELSRMRLNQWKFSIME